MISRRTLYFCLLWLAVSALTQVHAQTPPTAAQATLPSVKLQLGKTSVTAEVADTEPERESGLMFRKSLAPDSGMIFVMPSLQRADFWMKNTIIPLSVAFINSSGVILEIRDMKPQSEDQIISHFDTIAYALEMDQGWFSNHGILPGEQIGGLPPPPAR